MWRSDSFALSGMRSAAAPRMRRMLKMLEPMTFPRAMSDSFL